jgi:hypothetical protein
MKAMTSKDVLTLVGCKFYRYIDDDKLEIIRVMRAQNINTVKIRYEEDGREEKVDPQHILDNYRMLKADGIVVFSLVNVDAGGGKTVDDVIITLHRTSDLEDGNNVPYCVCRQNVNDIFYEYNNPYPEQIYAGCCVSIDTILEGMDYSIMTACNGVQMSNGVNVYLDDTLETILSMVKLKPYDTALFALGQAELKRINEPNHRLIFGYCPDVKTLLVQNNFMYDFNVCFGIVPLNVELNFTDETEEHLDALTTGILSYTFRTNITSTYVIPYAKDVDLSKIGIDYMIVKTPSNKMYIVGYTKEGEFVESEMAEDVMKKMHGVALAHDTSKYA